MTAMVQLFKRLGRYYCTLNPVAATEYIHTYRDMLDGEGQEARDG